MEQDYSYYLDMKLDKVLVRKCDCGQIMKLHYYRQGTYKCITGINCDMYVTDKVYPYIRGTRYDKTYPLKDPKDSCHTMSWHQSISIDINVKSVWCSICLSMRMVHKFTEVKA